MLLTYARWIVCVCVCICEKVAYLRRSIVIVDGVARHGEYNANSKKATETFKIILLKLQDVLS